MILFEFWLFLLVLDMCKKTPYKQKNPKEQQFNSHHFKITDD